MDLNRVQDHPLPSLVPTPSSPQQAAQPLVLQFPADYCALRRTPQTRWPAINQMWFPSCKECHFTMHVANIVDENVTLQLKALESSIENCHVVVCFNADLKKAKTEAGVAKSRLATQKSALAISEKKHQESIAKVKQLEDHDVLKETMELDELKESLKERNEIISLKEQELRAKEHDLEEKDEKILITARYYTLKARADLMREL